MVYHLRALVLHLDDVTENTYEEIEKAEELLINSISIFFKVVDRVYIGVDA